MTPNQLIQQAFEHFQAGRFPQAEAVLREILQQAPEQPQALHLLGLVVAGAGRSDEAIDLMERSVRGAPDVAPFHNNLGEAYRKADRREQAIGCYERAIQIDAKNLEAYNNLGITLMGLNRLEQAETALKRAIEIDPNFAQAHNNLAAVFLKSADAVPAPANPDRLELAMESAQRAVNLKPGYANAHGNLATALMRLGMYDEAAIEARKAIAADANQLDAHLALAGALNEYGEVDEPIAELRAAIAQRPEALEVWSDLLLTLNYHDRMSGPAIMTEHLRYAEAVREHNARTPSGFTRKAFANSAEPERGLRVGYLSPDFKVHAVSFFIEPILKHHDHSQFEVFCYANQLEDDDATQRMKTYADHWHNVRSLSDVELEALIRADGIDLLVELTAHTPNNRLPMMARKPAPVQLSYLGYPGTTGLSEIDYKVTDHWIDPVGTTESHHAEKLLRLPASYFCYQPPGDAPEVGPLPVETNGFVTFGSFTTLCKVSGSTMDLWARVMREIPDSKLIVQASGFRSAGAAERFRRLMGERRIEAARLDLRKPTSLDGYLRGMKEVDVGLDSWPFNGGTTTCHFLWMGVPVVTRPGRTSVSRIGMSVLTNVGLSELIATDDEGFVKLVSQLARDWARLKAMRAGLRERVRSSALCDAMGRTRELEAEYRRVWREWCEGAAR